MSHTWPQIWTLMEPFRGELVAFCLALFGSLIAWTFRPRVKLIWGRSNNSLHFIPAGEKRVEIYAEKFYLQNTGRKPATTVEFVLSFRPDDISIWQSRQYTEANSPDGSLVITLPFIAPGELVVVDTVYIDKVAANVRSVKCQDALAKMVPFATQRNFGTKLNVAGAILFLLGIAFVIRLLGIALLGS